jgi:hypothetical protein
MRELSSSELFDLIKNVEMRVFKMIYLSKYDHNDLMTALTKKTCVIISGSLNEFQSKYPDIEIISGEFLIEGDDYYVITEVKFDSRTYLRFDKIILRNNTNIDNMHAELFVKSQ